MLVSEMNPDKIAEQYRLYKAERAQREKEEAEAKAETAKRLAEIAAAKAKKEKPRKLRKPQRCFKCDGVIAAGEMGKPHSVPVGYGHEEGTHWKTGYKHYPECPTKKELKQ